MWLLLFAPLVHYALRKASISAGVKPRQACHRSHMNTHETAPIACAKERPLRPSAAGRHGEARTVTAPGLRGASPSPAHRSAASTTRKCAHPSWRQKCNNTGAHCPQLSTQLKIPINPERVNVMVVGQTGSWPVQSDYSTVYTLNRARYVLRNDVSQPPGANARTATPGRATAATEERHGLHRKMEEEWMGAPGLAVDLDVRYCGYGCGIEIGVHASLDLGLRS